MLRATAGHPRAFASRGCGRDVTGDTRHKADASGTGTRSEARGRLTGISHVALICRDMDASVHFYRDVLGLDVVATTGAAADRPEFLERREGGAAAGREGWFSRQYLFSLPDGSVLALREIPDSPDARETSPPTASHYWPAGAGQALRPHKLDHLALSVPSLQDVEWFVDRLTKHGIEVTGPFGKEDAVPTQFQHRIYFWDPSGNPLEIAVLQTADDPSIYFCDRQPVPALREQ